MIITPEMNPKDLYKNATQEMQHALEHFQKEIVKLRTSRANPSMVENVMVESYGNLMPLKDLALVTAPEARLLVIQPWDNSTSNAIEKGIAAAGLGLNPTVDGHIIRIQLNLEECRVAIRNVRKDIQNDVREAEKKKVVSEDNAKKLLDQLQKATDDSISKAEDISKKKEEEIKA
jgi:ribosome recycling factor